MQAQKTFVSLNGLQLLFKYFLVCFAFLVSRVIIAQDISREEFRTVDSLKLLLKKAKNDTDKLALLVKITEASDIEEGLRYGLQSVRFADKLLNEPYNVSQKKSINLQKSIALNNIGIFHHRDGNTLLGIDDLKESLSILEKMGDKKGVAKLLQKIGDLKIYTGDIQGGLNYYDQSLKIREEIGDKKGIAESLNNIGAVFNQQKDVTKAFDYYSRSLKIREEIGDKVGIAKSFNSIGILYKNKGNTDLALEYYNKSLKIREELGDKLGIAISYNNIGSIYNIKGDWTKALGFFNKSLKIKKELNDKESLSTSYNNIGGILFNQKKYLLARNYVDSSLTLAKELGFPYNIANAERLISQIDSGLGNYDQAFEHYKQFIIYRDSINNEGTRKASIKSQLKYEFEKKEAVVKEKQEKERVIVEERNRFQKIVIVSVILGLLLVLIFAGFIFRSLKITKQQKLIIEEKQKEILDSIRYAKRIQTSLLPSEKYLRKYLNRP